jgi:hypothetical protein
MKERKGSGDEDGAGSSGRGRKRTLRGGGVAHGVLATIQGSTTSVDARTEAPGVDGEGRNEVTEARKRDGIKEEWVYMLGGGEGAIWRAFNPVGTMWRTLPVCPCDPTFDMCDKE